MTINMTTATDDDVSKVTWVLMNPDGLKEEVFTRILDKGEWSKAQRARISCALAASVSIMTHMDEDVLRKVCEWFRKTVIDDKMFEMAPLFDNALSNVIETIHLTVANMNVLINFCMMSDKVNKITNNSLKALFRRAKAGGLKFELLNAIMILCKKEMQNSKEAKLYVSRLLASPESKEKDALMNLCLRTTNGVQTLLALQTNGFGHLMGKWWPSASKQIATEPRADKRLCGITGKPCVDPVRFADGLVYERDVLMNHFLQKGVISPRSGKIFTESIISYCRDMKMEWKTYLTTIEPKDLDFEFALDSIWHAQNVDSDVLCFLRDALLVASEDDIFNTLKRLVEMQDMRHIDVDTGMAFLKFIEVIDAHLDDLSMQEASIEMCDILIGRLMGTNIFEKSAEFSDRCAHVMHLTIASLSPEDLMGHECSVINFVSRLSGSWTSSISSTTVKYVCDGIGHIFQQYYDEPHPLLVEYLVKGCGRSPRNELRDALLETLFESTCGAIACIAFERDIRDHVKNGIFCRYASRWWPTRAKKLGLFYTGPNVVKDVTCGITGKHCIDPVKAEDGQIYERDALFEHYADRRTSPKTGKSMELLVSSVEAKALAEKRAAAVALISVAKRVKV